MRKSDKVVMQYFENALLEFHPGDNSELRGLPEAEKVDAGHPANRSGRRERGRAQAFRRPSRRKESSWISTTASTATGGWAARSRPS